MTDSALEDRLTNWGHSMRLHRNAGRTMSFEGRYRSPQSNHWLLPPTTYLGIHDLRDAWHVEAAWSSLPLFERIILRGHYCLLWTPGHICRIAATAAHRHCRESGYDLMRYAAQLLIAEALGRTDGTNRATSRDWVKEELDITVDKALND